MRKVFGVIMMQAPLVACAVLMTFVLFQSTSSADEKNSGESSTPKTDPKANLPEGVVARVGDDTISAEQVLARIYELEQHPNAENRRIPLAYQHLINEKIVFNEAERLGMTVEVEFHKKIADLRLEVLKRGVRVKYQGAIGWKDYIEKLGYNVDAFLDRLHKGTEFEILRYRLVNLFEQTTSKVRYTRITMQERAEALKVLAQLDAYKEKLEKNPQPNMKTMAQKFRDIAYLQSPSGRRPGTEVHYEGIPLADNIHKVLYEDTTVGDYTGIVELKSEDRILYHIFFIDLRTEGSDVTYKDLKEKLDNDLVKQQEGFAAEAVENTSVEIVKRDNYERWIKWVLAHGRYSIAFRYPGASEAGSLTPNKKEDD